MQDNRLQENQAALNVCGGCSCENSGGIGENGISLLTHVVATEMREIVMRMLGVLDSALTMVLAYYFGSSSSSRTKDETISKLAE